MNAKFVMRLRFMGESATRLDWPLVKRTLHYWTNDKQVGMAALAKVAEAHAADKYPNTVFYGSTIKIEPDGVLVRVMLLDKSI
jgi:hypothetical protein